MIFKILGDWGNLREPRESAFGPSICLVWEAVWNQGENTGFAANSAR